MACSTHARTTQSRSDYQNLSITILAKLVNHKKVTNPLKKKQPTTFAISQSEPLTVPTTLYLDKPAASKFVWKSILTADHERTNQKTVCACVAEPRGDGEEGHSLCREEQRWDTNTPFTHFRPLSPKIFLATLGWRLTFLIERFQELLRSD